METDAGIALTTGSATAASDIERNRDEIADLEVLDIAALLDHCAGDLVAQHHAGRRRGAAANHMLIGAANVRRNDFQYHAVMDFLSRRIL
jgi:hypothetical protein